MLEERHMCSASRYEVYGHQIQIFNHPNDESIKNSEYVTSREPLWINNLFCQMKVVSIRGQHIYIKKQSEKDACSFGQFPSFT